MGPLVSIFGELNKSNKSGDSSSVLLQEDTRTIPLPLVLANETEVGAMIKNKKPWYIWLSIIMFMLLFGDTARRTTFFKGRTLLWNRACINIFKCMILGILFPCIASVLLLRAFPASDWPPNSIFEVVGDIIRLLPIYFGGVYATYNHYRWRNKNMAHLFKQSEVHNLSEEDIADTTDS